MESGRGRPRGLEEVLAELGVHAASPGKSCGAQKLSPHPAPDAVMVGRGQVAGGSGREQPPVIWSSPRGPRRHHMTRRAFSSIAMLKE